MSKSSKKNEINETTPLAASWQFAAQELAVGAVEIGVPFAAGLGWGGVGGSEVEQAFRTAACPHPEPVATLLMRGVWRFTLQAVARTEDVTDAGGFTHFRLKPHCGADGRSMSV